MRRAPIAIAVILALAALGFGLFTISQLPKTLTLAVGPEGRETHRYAEAAAATAQDMRERIRFNLVVTEGAEASARLLDAGRVDLAIIRSDLALPANGQSILVNAKRYVIIVAPQRSRTPVRSVSDLKGKRIGVVRLTDPNLPLVKRVLFALDVPESDANFSEIDFSEAADKLATNQLDVVIAVTVPAAPPMLDAMREMQRRAPGGVRIIPIPGAQGVADRMIGLEAVELAAGAFGAGRPDEEVTTVAVSYRTVAHRNMSEAVASRTAKTLYDMRARLARQVPIAYFAEAPEATEGPKLPVHPGAAQFFNGETKTLYERYGDMIVSSLWGFSIVGSGFAALVAWLSRRRHTEADDLIQEVAALTTQARAARGPELDDIEHRSDAIVAKAAMDSHHGRMSSEALESLGLALEHLRSVIEGVRSRRA